MNRRGRNFKRTIYRLYGSNRATIPSSYGNTSFFETLADDIGYYYFGSGHAFDKPLKIIRNNHFDLPNSFSIFFSYNKSLVSGKQIGLR
jgi:hypothetical protein